MPEYVCMKCGKVWYGWGVGLVCDSCGGELRAMEDFEEDCRDYMREGHVDSPAQLAFEF